jgi:hypothetical protein
MTPQDKAKELVYKYKDAPFNCLGCDMPYCDVPCTMLNIEESKQCALIAVQEMIYLLDELQRNKEVIEQFGFLLEVKKEIEKL